MEGAYLGMLKDAQLAASSEHLAKFHLPLREPSGAHLWTPKVQPRRKLSVLGLQGALEQASIQNSGDSLSDGAVD